MKKSYIYITIAITIILLCVFLYPVFLNSNSGIPRWVREGNIFVYDVGKAIKQYANEHDGQAPSSLSELYPRYTNDRRVTSRNTELAGEEVVIDYHKPAKLGNPESVVIQIQSTRKKYFRPVTLYGDLGMPGIM